MISPSTVIVGIGSPHGDDQAGWLVAERLAVELDQHPVTVRQAKSPVDLLDWLDGVEDLIVCDACRGLGRAGETRRWTWPNDELEDVAWSGSHDLSLLAALQLSEHLGRRPRKVTIWTIEGACCDALSPVTADVASAIPGLINEIKSEVSAMPSQVSIDARTIAG